MERKVMSLKFCKFKFIKKTSPKLFCKYEIISSNPYSDKKNFNGNSVRYQILQYKENKKDNKRIKKGLVRVFFVTKDKTKKQLKASLLFLNPLIFIKI